jgi:ADP-heptose:LPS heptosyltransferase
MKEKIEKILLVRKYKLGDCLLFTPVLEALHREYPQAQMDIITGSDFGTAFWGAYPYIDRIWNENDLFQRTSYRYKFRFIRGIRRQGYDLILVSSMETGYAFKAFLMGIPRRIGFKEAFYYSPGWDRWAFLYTESISAGHELREVQRNLELLKKLGIKSGTTELRYYPNPARKESLRPKLQGKVWQKSVIISLVGHSPGRSLPIEIWKKLASRLNFPEDWGAIITGTAEDYQQNEVYRSYLNCPSINLSGRTDLDELYYLLQSGRCLLGVDSGIMHLATMTGITLFILWGPGNPQVFSPIHYTSAEIHLFRADHTCGPCQEVCSERECYRNLDLDSISRQFDDWISTQPKISSEPFC